MGGGRQTKEVMRGFTLKLRTLSPNKGVGRRPVGIILSLAEEEKTWRGRRLSWGCTAS